MNKSVPMPVLIAAIIAVALFVIGPLFLVVVNTGKVGILSVFGNVSDRTLNAGLNVKNPFAKVTQLSVRTEEYTMSAAETEGRVLGDDSVEARASDGALVKIDVTVLFRLRADSAVKVFKDLGERYESKIVRPVIRSAIREVIAKYTVNEVYSTKRDEIAGAIKEQITKSVDQRGITVEETLFRDVKLSEALSASIELKLTAQQEAEKYVFVLDRERKEAERKVIEAKGQKEAQTLVAQGLSDKYLQYLYIVNLKDRQGTIYVPTEGGLPLFKSVN